ncbi:MAG: NUDIX hydrolase [Verrucomicrobia bacterium]|nr:NUDIX hydrolase [Verrucomicrobiota bacterium]
MKNTLKSDLDVELAAGGLVWDRGRGTPLLAVIHRPKHDDWTLPKGKQKPGETLLETAVREVAEELGCEFEVENFAGVTCYKKGWRSKVVFYWNMLRRDDRPFQPNDEVDAVEWLPFEQALARLTFPAEREVVERNRIFAPAATALA